MFLGACRVRGVLGTHHAEFVSPGAFRGLHAPYDYDSTSSPDVTFDFASSGPKRRHTVAHGASRGNPDENTTKAPEGRHILGVTSVEPTATVLTSTENMATLPHRRLSRMNCPAPPSDKCFGSAKPRICRQLRRAGCRRFWCAAASLPLRNDRITERPTCRHSEADLRATVSERATVENTARHDLRSPKRSWPTFRLRAGNGQIFLDGPPGGTWRHLPRHLQEEALGPEAFAAGGGKTGFFRRLSWDSPSPTITGRSNRKASAVCHPDHARPLSVLESARLQGFPDDWQFEGSMSSQYMQVGNAVPISLGMAIGNAIAAHDSATRKPAAINLDVEHLLATATARLARDRAEQTPREPKPTVAVCRRGIRGG